jgi:sporulation protein YlmC with PRC-barrel domain
MMHPTRAGIGLVRLGDSDFVPANPEDDLCGKDVYTIDGKVIGSVEDLYIDRKEREVRFLEVGAGGFLGIGEKHLLVPVEAVTEVAAGRVTIEPGRAERVAGSAPFDTKVAPPPTAARRSDRYASMPFGITEGTADHRGDIHASLPYGRRPY